MDDNEKAAFDAMRDRLNDWTAMPPYDRMLASWSAGAEWARKQTLEEAARTVEAHVASMDRMTMGYEDAVVLDAVEEIATAIRALGTPGEES